MPEAQITRQWLPAQFRSQSFDEEARTVDVVWSTGAPVARRTWEHGEHFEELAMNAKAVRLDRLNSGAPVLNSHDAYALEGVIGAVVQGSARIENGQGIATLRFSNRPEVAGIVQDVRDGILTNLSVGYRIHKFEIEEAGKGLPKTLRATDWEPFEVSVVSVPADPNARIRNEVSTMTEHAEIETEPAPKKFGAKERREMATRFLPNEVAETFARANNRLDERAFRDAILDELVERQERSPTFPVVDTRGMQSLDDPDTFRQAATGALVARMQGKRPEGISGEVYANGEVAFARRVLGMAGQDVRGMPDSMVLRNYMTTSDFALITGAAANIRIKELYEAAAAPITALFGRRDLPDFNVHMEAGVDWTTLKIDRVNEHGEFENSFVDESGETMVLHTYGGIVGLSRQLLHNAAGALNDMATKQARRLAAFRADKMVALVEGSAYAGPKLRDGVAVFHTDRANIKTLAIDTFDNAAISVMNARAAHSKRKGGGDVIIGSTPKYWLVPAEGEAFALKTLAAVQASELAKVNPAAGKLAVAVEPRLSATDHSWLVSEPSEAAGAVEALLEGQDAPFTETNVGFRVDGVEFKIRHDFGLGFLSWRSWTRLDGEMALPSGE